jgi:hypothetical protein
MAELARTIGGKMLIVFIVGDILGAGIYALGRKPSGILRGAVWLPPAHGLAVAVLLSAAGWFTLASGRSQLRNVHPVPPETMSTLKENSEWIAKRLSSVRK